MAMAVVWNPSGCEEVTASYEVPSSSSSAGELIVKRALSSPGAPPLERRERVSLGWRTPS